MNLPGGIEAYENSYMAFFVNGKETDVPLNSGFMNRKRSEGSFSSSTFAFFLGNIILSEDKYNDGSQGCGRSVGRQ